MTLMGGPFVSATIAAVAVYVRMIKIMLSLLQFASNRTIASDIRGLSCVLWAKLKIKKQQVCP